MYFIFAGVSEWSAVYVIRGQLIASQKDAPSFHAWRENLPVAHPVPSGPSWVPRLYFYISYKLHSAFLVILPRLNSRFYLKKKKSKMKGVCRPGRRHSCSSLRPVDSFLSRVLFLRHQQPPFRVLSCRSENVAFRRCVNVFIWPSFVWSMRVCVYLLIVTPRDATLYVCVGICVHIGIYEYIYIFLILN